MVELFKNAGKQAAKFLHNKFLQWTAPAKSSALGGAVFDATRTKAQLIAENALLRQQLIVLERQFKQAQFKPLDRFLMVVLASWLPYWRQVLLIVKPDTLISWHKQSFKLFWKLKRLV